MSNSPKKSKNKPDTSNKGKDSEVRSKVIVSYTSLSEVEDKDDTEFIADVAHKAAVNAINENMALGIPVTVLEDGWVVRKAADGSIEKITKIDPKVKRATTLVKGTILHVRAHQ